MGRVLHIDSLVVVGKKRLTIVMCNGLGCSMEMWTARCVRVDGSLLGMSDIRLDKMADDVRGICGAFRIFVWIVDMPGLFEGAN